MAIKVNGTTVINDSRALTNVASVDATTATAIGAAGVGGNTVYLGQTTFSSTTAAYDISLPSGYRMHKIIGHGPRGLGYSSRFYLRLGDNSGSIITSNVYNYTAGGHGGGAVIAYSQSFIDTTQETWANDNAEAFSLIEIDIFAARDSSKETAVLYNLSSTYHASGARGANGGGHIKGAADNSKIRMFSPNENFLGDSTKVCYLYGIK